MFKEIRERQEKENIVYESDRYLERYDTQAKYDMETLLRFADEAQRVIDLAYKETGLVDCRKFLERWEGK